MLGLYDACFEWKWAEAQSAWQRSIELSPTNVMALLSYSINRSSWGDFQCARELVKRAQSIDPLYDYGEFCAALPDFCTQRFDRVVERLTKYLKLDPPFWWGLWTLWRALSLTGRTAEAVDACRKAFSITGRDAIAQLMEKVDVEDALGTAACSLAEYYQHHYTSPYDIATLGGMRAMNDPVMLLYFLYPFVFAFAAAGVFDIIKSSLTGKNVRDKGLMFGALLFTLVTIPSVFVMASSMDYPVGFYLAQVLEGIIGYPVLGILFTRIWKL